MSVAPLPRRLLAEALATALLLATVIGSGVMGESLSGGNVAIALIGNTLPTGAMLTVLILAFAPVSGAHMNPAVSIAFALRDELSWRDCAAYVPCQLGGAVLGVLAAHAMFDLPLLQLSVKARTGAGQWFAEAVATFGLVLAIFGCLRHGLAAVAAAVGLYITAAYWFTASTSFANPAVTVARAFSDTFAGIAWPGVAPFIAAQLVGMLAALAVAHVLWANSGESR
jgi:glycerol uptake facilitator-like aquaporin